MHTAHIRIRFPLGYNTITTAVYHGKLVWTTKKSCCLERKTFEIIKENTLEYKEKHLGIQRKTLGNEFIAKLFTKAYNVL